MLTSFVGKGGEEDDRQSIYVEEGEEEERREDFAIFFVGIGRVAVVAAANAIPPRSPCSCVRAVVCPLDALGQLPPSPLLHSLRKPPRRVPTYNRIRDEMFN